MINRKNPIGNTEKMWYNEFECENSGGHSATQFSDKINYEVITMNEMELYSLWCEKAVDDPDLQTELKSIAGDSDAIKDGFRDLEFGTGGLFVVLSVQVHTE